LIDLVAQSLQTDTALTPTARASENTCAAPNFRLNDERSRDNSSLFWRDTQMTNAASNMNAATEKTETSVAA
jgi:hypothetical protein